MRPAAFLDRDGTIIELVHHLTDPAEVRLIDGAGAAIRRLNEAGWPVVIATNQSVIGRGKTDAAGVARVHDAMSAQLARHGARVDAIYLCPLAPTIKDSTVIEDEMRKPGPGMLLTAAREHDLDLGRSWMVGDTVSDVLAGRNAGARSILVRTGYGADYAYSETFFDRDVPDLGAAVDVILRSDDA